jgi:sugar phosphate isomerase/epimerase
MTDIHGTALFGYTGLVGSNLLTKYKFDFLYNSKNIEDARYKNFKTIFICCLPAVKWLANKNPLNDTETFEKLQSIFKTITAQNIILISTIDIYDSLDTKCNENSVINYQSNHTYGKNRYLFELFIKQQFSNYYIIRLPALFGYGLKKNVIYDLLHNNNINQINKNSQFQWYDLEWIKEDIDLCLQNKLTECNLFTEPLETILILNLFNYDYSTNPASQFNYNVQTVNDCYFKQGKNGYIRDKTSVYENIFNFIANYMLDNESIKSNLFKIKNNELYNENIYNENIYNENICNENICNENTYDKNITNKKYKLCVSNISCNKLLFEQYYKILKYHNIDYIEIAPTKYHQWFDIFKTNNTIFETTQKSIQSFGLKLYSFQSITFTIPYNIFDQNSDNLLLHLKNVIDLACSLNVEKLVFGCPKNRKIMNNLNEQTPSNANFKNDNDLIFIKFMNELGNYIGDRNLVICIENNSRMYDCNYLNTIYEVGEITKKINHKNIKMMVDLGNCIMENDTIIDMVKYKDLIHHIHISTPFMNPLISFNKRIYQNFITILNNIDYDKVISLEFLNNQDDELENLNKSLRNFNLLFENTNI